MMLSSMSKLWDTPFNPHGKTSNAVRVAIGYSLPDEQPSGADYQFMDNMHNQTYLANLSTLEVITGTAVEKTTVKNWLYNRKMELMQGMAQIVKTLHTA